MTDAQYRLSQLGLWATACTDILLMGVTAANLEKGDVVLAISHSGSSIGEGGTYLFGGLACYAFGGA